MKSPSVFCRGIFLCCITGGTGVGKSSTINALFGREISSVGIHAEPETMEIKSYALNDKITLWDSPGLGDGRKDPEHARKIVELLHRKDSSGAYMIDLVLDGVVKVN